MKRWQHCGGHLGLSQQLKQFVEEKLLFFFVWMLYYTPSTHAHTHTHRERHLKLIKMVPHGSLLLQQVFYNPSFSTQYIHPTKASQFQQHSVRRSACVHKSPWARNLNKSTRVSPGGPWAELGIKTLWFVSACVTVGLGRTVCWGVDRWWGSVCAACCGARWCVLAKYSAEETELLRIRSLTLLPRSSHFPGQFSSICFTSVELRRFKPFKFILDYVHFYG